MSNFNKLANDPKYRAIVRPWVRKTSPLIYLFAPSNEGKTTLLGSLFPRDPAVAEKIPLWSYEHDDYCRVLVIDADQGTTTIEHYTGNEKLCDLRSYDTPAADQLAWTYKQLASASAAECNSIIIEGLIAVHHRLLANELRKNPGASGNVLRRCHIGPSMHGQGLIDAVRQIKQDRVAAGMGVPIFVSLNTKSESIDPEKPDSPSRYVPGWSKNLINEAMGGSDAHLQLKRPPTGTQLITMKQEGTHPFCKMRNADVAEAVQRETNLNLPGLLTLWAVTIDTKSNKVNAALDKRAEQQQTSNPST
jgi:hypothetical protein